MDSARERDALADELIRAVRSVTTSLFRTVRDHPAACGSALLCKSDDRLFVLSVIHVLESGGWAMETDCVVNGRALLIELPPMNWVVQSVLDDEGKIIAKSSDGMAWVELNVAKLCAEANRCGHAVGLNVYEGSLSERARSGEVYHFAAGVPRGFDPCLRDLLREPIIESEMTYDGDDVRGFNCFKVAGKHRGDEYKGASGAPILNSDGTAVALVQGGSPHAGVLYGVPLAMFSPVLQLSATTLGAERSKPAD